MLHAILLFVVAHPLFILAILVLAIALIKYARAKNTTEKEQLKQEIVEDAKDVVEAAPIPEDYKDDIENAIDKITGNEKEG